MRRLFLLLAPLLLFGCAPTLQVAESPGAGFQGPHLEKNVFVSFDGARLGLTRWDARGGAPWAVIIGVHGMDDWAHAFHLAAPYWADRGVTTLAYDVRGFGRSPDRGLWAPDALNVEDLRTLVAVARRTWPKAKIAVVGESMGGAIAIEAFASADPPDADRLVLAAPAVWGWSTQPITYQAALWIVAHAAPSEVLTPPSWLTRKISASDNVPELIAMSHDPMMLWGARADALYGLVDTMQAAYREIGRIKAPTLYLYGAHDEIIRKKPAIKAADRLPPGSRSAYYLQGWHLLLRDLQAHNVWADTLAFIRDPAAPLPSGAPPVPETVQAARRLSTESARVVASGGPAYSAAGSRLTRQSP
ncbi:MAG TPA: alpha/beta fold hydrolase [Caulobacteraceae bacterium]|nr:alpha/beta fold hydrolase [Caulobacteraceae bacterium]